MKTLRLNITPEDLDSKAARDSIATAAEILRGGGIVAFPTETVYGLGANALDSQAVERIFEAKQRPAWDPLIVHISDRTMLARVVAGVSSADSLPPSAARLVAAFWPGPLTLLLPKADGVPPIVTAGRPLVGVRMPSHPVARALIAAAGVPLAAPSANRFGRTSPTSAAHVLEDLDGRIDAVIDAGPTAHGLESTVVDASREPVVLYRPGIISLDQIREVCATAEQWQPPQTASAAASTAEVQPESMPSPGLGIRHYAPRASLVLIGIDGPHAPSAALLHAIEKAASERRKVGVMLPDNFLPETLSQNLRDTTSIFDWGDWADPPMLAHRLFAGLRRLDADGVDLILCPVPPAKGLGSAIRDRLLKAAKTP
jgi:L-threonylcarbamoyladenylate synthase